MNVDRARFWAEVDVKTLSVPELLGRYLESTDSAILKENRLSMFAEDCYRHFGWTGTCGAYEHMLLEDIGDPHSIYHSWTFFGTALMKDAKNLSFEERVRIAKDVESVFERAAQDLGYYWSNTIAYFYYDHPLKAEQLHSYLLKSKE